MKKVQAFVGAVMLLFAGSASAVDVGGAAITSLEGSNTGLAIMLSGTCIETGGTKGPYMVRTEAFVPGTDLKNWRNYVSTAIIAACAEGGFTVTADRVAMSDIEVGTQPDEAVQGIKASWTKDITKTSIGTTLVNVYTSASGSPQPVFFTGYQQYRITGNFNKVGTGTITISFADVTNSANALSITNSEAAGEKFFDSGWQTLPAWATGEIGIRIMARSTVASDSPVMRDFQLSLR